MIPRLIRSGILAAIAGAAIAIAVPSSPSFAFTLSSPSVTEQGFKADVQEIYYYRRYYYHPYYHRVTPRQQTVQGVFLDCHMRPPSASLWPRTEDS
jgi:hypothetical protein